jgi:pimeloyl-ACP methyl ester carboxylesterase
MRKGLRVLFWVVLSLIILALIVPLLIPVPPLENTRPVEALADPDSLFATIDGINFHYKTAGAAGPDLVLLHGFGASQYSWREVMPALAENHTVYAYDRLAFGLTERPATWTGDNPYTPAASIRQLGLLLDSWMVSEAILIGNSAGGAVAMEYALAHPDQIKALILVSPALGGGSPLAGYAWLYATPQIQRLGPLLVRGIQDSGLETIDQAWHDPSKQPADTIPLYTKPLQAENWDLALWYLSTTGEASSLPERLGEFSLPILVITGDDDRIVPTQSTVEVARKLPRAELVVLENCGHVPQEECPEAFLQAVLSFIGSLEP